MKRINKQKLTIGVLLALISVSCITMTGFRQDKEPVFGIVLNTLNRGNGIVQVEMLVHGQTRIYRTVEEYNGDPLLEGGCYRFQLTDGKLDSGTYEFANIKMVEAAVRKITSVDADSNRLVITDTNDSRYAYSDDSDIYLAKISDDGVFDGWVPAEESVFAVGAYALALDMQEEENTVDSLVDSVFVIRKSDYEKLNIVIPPDGERTFRNVDGVISRGVAAEKCFPHDESTSILLTESEYIGDDVAVSGISAITEIVYDTVVGAQGRNLELVMNMVIPQSDEPLPAVVFAPGGGFTNAPTELPGRRNKYIGEIWLAEQGYVVAMLQYRVLSQGTAYDAVTDAKSAIRFLRANAVSLNINPEKIGMMGQSAGGWLAALTAVTNGVKEFERGENLAYSSEISCAIDMYGLSDLTRISIDHSTGTLAQHYWTDCSDGMFVNGSASGLTIWDDWRAAEKVNPVKWVDKDDVPFLIYHGSADRRVSPSSTLFLHNALLKADVETTRYVVDGGDHGGAPYNQMPIMTQVLDFLDTNLK